MPNSIKFSQFSFSAKLSIILFILATMLLAILFILIVPKMQKEQYAYELNLVEKTIALNTQQLKLAVRHIVNDGKHNRLHTVHYLEKEFYLLKDSLKQKEFIEHEEVLKKLNQKLSCEVNILNKSNKKALFKNIKLENDGYKQFVKSNSSFDKWHTFVKRHQNNFCPSITKHLVYTESLNSNEALFLSCNTKNFYDDEKNEEKEIKKYIQKSFSYTDYLHKGNTFLMWMNLENLNDNPLYQRSDELKNNKYCISKVSNVKAIKTGLLSSKQLYNAINKEPLIHYMDKDDDIGNFKYKVITWVRGINDDEKRRLIFITTVYEEDLHNNIDSIFMKILPASLLALFMAILLGFILFRRFSKSLDILVKTSKEVRLGNLNLRSNIKGNDHVAQLGHTFDLMLDSMQSNIKNLDAKVENRTKELSKSLDEKSTLLKEVHHRVKNNLAFTINLLKLQKRKVNDENTKELLTDIQERIYVMELLHRKLYESRDLSSIPFRKYIKDLVNDVLYAYKIDNLILDIEVDDIFLDIEYALPCGLIINECVTNSFKHAFENKEKKLSISLKKQKNICTLIIADNGKGLPKDLDVFKTKSLGLRLITSISKQQLLGDIEVSSKNGVKFTISFEIK